MITGDGASFSDLGQTLVTGRTLPGRRESCYAQSIYSEPCSEGDIFAPGDAGFFGMGQGVFMPGVERPDYAVNPLSGMGQGPEIVFDGMGQGVFMPGVERPDYAVNPLSDVGQEIVFSGLGQTEGQTSNVANAVTLGGLSYLLFRGATSERQKGWQIAGYVGGALLGLSALGVAANLLGLKVGK